MYQNRHLLPMVGFFAALGELTRFRIVELLCDGPRAVGDIAKRLRIDQPRISKHLRTLRNAGLVEVDVRAQQRVYELRPIALILMHDWLERTRPLWGDNFVEIAGLVDSVKSSRRTSRRGRNTK
jgi:DNA-binding transcriptional ArsR family regulator